MQTPPDIAAHENPVDAIRRSFYRGELPVATDAGRSALAAIDPATHSADAQCQRARVLLWLVRCARRADELDTALSHAYTGIAAAKAGGSIRLECLLRAQYVHVLASLGQNETALDEGYKVLRRAVEIADTLAQAAGWLALGQVHWAMQQWHEGERAYTEALTLAGLCGDREICSLASNGIAAMEDHHATEARAAGDAAAARVHACRSFELLNDFVRGSQEIGDAYNAWIGRYNQACCLFGMGDHAKARELLDTQLASLEGEVGSRHQLVLQVLGDIHLARSEHEPAIRCHTEALAIAERLHLPMLAMDACRSLVDSLERSGDFQAALTQHRRYFALYVQLASTQAQAQARAMAVIYDTEKTLSLAEAQRQRADGLALANSNLVQEKAVLQRSSMEDALTGLANRRCFDQTLAHTLRSDSPAGAHALVMIDVDHFKRINDRFSHLVGDEVLRRLGALLQRHGRKQDLSARFGGEEFALILADVNRPTARAVAERLRAAVEAEPWAAVHPELQVTVSIGVVHADEAQRPGQTPDLLAIADARLYEAKGNGRNRVVGATG